MVKVALFYEISEGVHKILFRNAEDNVIKISKSKRVKTTGDKPVIDLAEREIKSRLDTYEFITESGKKIYEPIEPKDFMIKTFWGEKPIIGDILRMFGWGHEHIPLYHASYKNSTVIPWNAKVIKGNMDMNTYKLMSEEDSLHELLTPDTPRIEEWVI